MTSLLLPGRLLLIGCGNMAGAMLDRWLACGLDGSQVTVVRPSGAPVGERVQVLTQPPIDHSPAMALLGVKPQKLDEIAPAYRHLIGPDTLLVSILAGVEHSSLTARFPAAGAIVRAMPNTPVAIGKGAVALYGEDVGADARTLTEMLMAPLGHFEWIGDEARFDLVTALAGSGPAFLFRFIDALAAGAAALGLPAEQAQRLAVATVEGAAALAAAADETPHQLAERVASPGGMTRQGLNVLDADDALRDLVRRTLDATARRGREMADAARSA